jgi:hypothetical protein
VILAFEGSVQSPPAGRCSLTCGPEQLLQVTIGPLEAEYTEIMHGVFVLTLQSSFVALGASSIDVLRFLSLSIEEGQAGDVELLIGRPPRLTGSGGVFPLAAGGLLEFELEALDGLGGVTTRFTISATLVIGDTALQAAARINAAALLAGVLVPIASVVGGQLRVVGDRPGAVEGLRVSNVGLGTAFGFTGDEVAYGLGSPLLIDRVFVVSLAVAAGWQGADVWLRGGAATFAYVAAGS